LALPPGGWEPVGRPAVSGRTKPATPGTRFRYGPWMLLRAIHFMAYLIATVAVVLGVGFGLPYGL
jgi:hypothetical protein